MVSRGVCVLQKVRWKLYVGLQTFECITVITLPYLIAEFWLWAAQKAILSPCGIISPYWEGLSFLGRWQNEYFCLNSSNFLLLVSSSLSPMPMSVCPHLASRRVSFKGLPIARCVLPCNLTRYQCYAGHDFFFVWLVGFFFLFFELCIISVELVSHFLGGSEMQHDNQLLF